MPSIDICYRGAQNTHSKRLPATHPLGSQLLILVPTSNPATCKCVCFVVNTRFYLKTVQHCLCLATKVKWRVCFVIYTKERIKSIICLTVWLMHRKSSRQQRRQRSSLLFEGRNYFNCTTPKMDVFPKTFLQIILAVKWLAAFQYVLQTTATTFAFSSVCFSIYGLMVLTCRASRPPPWRP